MEYRRRRFDGVYRWFHTSVQPLLGPNGEVVRWYGLLTDIDDRRSMEESLRRTQGKLSQAMQLATASELAASIVHEISQPIAAMVANGQACLRWLSMSPPNDANARSVVERILRDGKDATPVIKGLRTLFKRSPPEKTFVNLYHTVAEVFTLVHGRAERQGVAIDLQVPEDLTQVAADRIQLQQVLLNLVSNAIDSMQDVVDNPKKLIIRSQRQENVILTEIVDQGVGVTDYEEIFETFFTTKENGMGMGLAICRSIIEAHDGHFGHPLDLRPEASLPSLFRFRVLPCEVSDAGYRRIIDPLGHVLDIVNPPCQIWHIDCLLREQEDTQYEAEALFALTWHHVAEWCRIACTGQDGL